ncbi:MAG: hypothetical protein IMZ52_02440 [Actinobacteria bacterium]|nr:hypothetical protein [Actinomycetota bacterium]MBE3122654.1 hypothetical protein [Thermoplasmata archaeon]
MDTPEDAVVEECLNYIETVQVFSFLDKKLDDSQIEHEIEKDLELKPPKTKCNPDFIIHRDELTDILEHKASLPNNEEYVLEEITDCYNKYNTVMFNKVECQPNLIFLYPKKKEYLIKKIQNQIPKGIQLCYFNLGDQEIDFQKDVKVVHPELANVLKYSPYPYARHNYSKHKFIKAEPHQVYTAFQVNLILRSFQDISTVNQPSYIVKKDDVLSVMNTYYPPWINENLMQINSGRLNHALEFLDKIEAIEWDREKGEITVFKEKGRKSGDILKNYAKKWCKIQAKKKQSKSRKKIEHVEPSQKNVQTSLSDIFK